MKDQRREILHKGWRNFNFPLCRFQTPPSFFSLTWILSISSAFLTISLHFAFRFDRSSNDPEFECSATRWGGKRVDSANSERKQKQAEAGQDTGPLPYLGWVGREDFYRTRGSEKKRLIHAKPSSLFIPLFLFIFNVDSKLHCSHLHH